MLDWRELTRLSDTELARLDIATVNLACAAGLPGSERIDYEYCLRALDAWTDIARRWTEAAYVEYFLADRAEFNHSESYFRIVALVTSLQRHCGVKYDASKIGLGPEAPFEFDEQFIHGVIQGPGGTCGNLPVVYAAIGRRLGYPIKLVRTRQHLFCRWDDPVTGVRMNIEGAGDGFAVYPDDHYRHWPVPIRDAEQERAFGYLKSMTPRQELATFVGQRAFRMVDCRRYKEAVATFVIAAELDPEHVTYPSCVMEVLKLWEKWLKEQYPPRFPKIDVLLRPDKRRWPSAPWEVERAAAVLESAEWCLTEPRHVEWWWGPLRKGRRPMRDVPSRITVSYEQLSEQNVRR